MSSSPRPERAGRWWQPGRWPLRTKLSAVSVLLVAVVCVVIGLATVLSLRAFLVGQLDTQLSHAAQGPPPRPGDGPPVCGSAALPVDPFPRGLPPNSIDASFETNGLISGYMFTTDLCQASLSTTDVAAIAPSAQLGVAYTRQVGSLGDYRLVATLRHRLDNTEFVEVFGLPMTSVN